MSQAQSDLDQLERSTARRQPDKAAASTDGSIRADETSQNPDTFIAQSRALVARGQFVAAEAVLEKACIALPESFELMVAQADLAHRQRNWAVSEHRWQLLKQRFGSLPKIVAHLADALRHQKKFDAAEAMLSEALLSEPGNQDMAEMFARIAEGRTDFAEADRRWAVVAQRFPSSISARVAQITARVKLGDLTGAEAVAAVAADMFPNNEQVLAAHARVATHAANWPEALLRWNRVRSMAPQHADYWWQQARALRSQRRDADARLLLAEAAKLFPDNRPIILLHAELLTEAGFWSEAADLWTTPILTDSDDRRLQEHAFAAKWRALGTESYSLKETIPASISEVPARPRDIMLRFEAFGVDSEFSMIQRHFGAEPVSLLRWAQIDTAQLTAALNSDLTGIGDRDHTRLALGSDFKLRDRRFDFASHTWVTEDQTDRETFLRQQCRRLQYLRRNLLEDIAEGDKVLVYKSALIEPFDEVRRLHAAIRRIGPATLLYVKKADAEHPPRTVEKIEDGLLVGHLSNLVGAGNTEIDRSGWVSILQQALLLSGAADEQTINSLSKQSLVQRFEGLGNNCEFGYVQRIEGAEPLGLLRWATTKLSVLADAFEQNLDGIGDPDNTELYTHLDYRSVDPRYGLSIQTFVNAEQTDRESLLEEHCLRLRRLRQKLLDDLRAGAKVLVHKTSPDISWEEVRALHAAVQRHGSATLLHVRQSVPGCPNGTVKQVVPGLLVGYVDRLVAIGGGWDADRETWLALCRRALEFVHPQPGGQTS